MAEDRKFFWDEGLKCFRNRVNGAEIPHDEPVILFRARNIHALAVLGFYLTEIKDPHHREAVTDRIMEFSEWRWKHEESMKEPGITHDIRLNREEGRVCISDANGLHPSNLDRAVEEQRSYQIGPGKGMQLDLRPICSEDGCHRREDCGPLC